MTFKRKRVEAGSNGGGIFPEGGAAVDAKQEGRTREAAGSVN